MVQHGVQTQQGQVVKEGRASSFLVCEFTLHEIQSVPDGGIICFLFLEEAALYSGEFWDPKLLHKSCRKGLVYFPS